MHIEQIDNVFRYEVAYVCTLQPFNIALVLDIV
jgi:hypothetical protein